MSIEWVNQAIDDLRAWGRARGVVVDADEIRLLCDYASDYLNVNELGDFTPATFDELLLSIYPRKVIAPPESAPETVAAARTLVDFLQQAGAVGEETAAAMREELTGIEPKMPGALADTANFGMAKSLFSSIGPESLEQSVAIPSGELPDMGEAPCDCPGCAPLPAVRLAEPDALVAELANVPLLGGKSGKARKYRELEKELRRDVGDDPLQTWAEIVAHIVERDTRGTVTGSAELDEELYDLFDMLYRLRAPVPITVIGDYLEEVADAGGADLGAVLDRLAWCGMVTVEGDAAGLTPLAVWGLREHYLALGLDAPQADDLAEADATGLIEGLLDGMPTELAEEDISRWLAGRSPVTAAAELLAAASGAPAVARGIAVTIVDRLGAEAEPEVRACLEDQELRPHAIHWLTARGLTAPQLSQEELLWVSIDMLALALPAAEEAPEIFAENMAASGPPAHLIEEMWRVDHPDVVDVLELLGRSLPDGTVAKAARKAAFKARSRAIR
ncbi:hypothetical protein [Nonomuraea aurantiaca]|uniref:hypothetical protein n=1 Tax=Nonomuraea aurantiaca TaxID=2878562 RepID=UPI001CD93416|nr:hypothetical protein [Nonomuraea aurantiaca]MCA2226956.1 hypothetical protein [Nonomuraea aurantiaca]